MGESIRDTMARTALSCGGCGFTAAPGDDWEAIDDPVLGSLTRCPDCGSTNVTGNV